MIGTNAARLLLAVALIPFLYFAIRDQVLHFSARRVPIAENVLHLFLGIILFVLIARAFQFDRPFVTIGALVFAGTGALDEFIFHRGLPESESDVHAKEHFALFIFLTVFWFLSWR